MTGDCQIDGDCVSSMNWPATHGDFESCSIYMLEDVSVSIDDNFGIEDILETHVGQHDPESTVIQKGNAVMDGVNWIGSILGSTANFLSDFDAPNETFSTDYRN